MWQKLRLPFLVLTFLYVFTAFLISIFKSHNPPSLNDNFSFPQKVIFPNLDFISSKNLSPNVHSYQYQDSLEIMISYETNTDGEVTKLIFKNLSIPFDKIENNFLLREKSNIGKYGVFIYGEKAHLSTCINPVGFSTFTKVQFNENVKKYSMTPKRILDYVLTGENLRDRRCFWTDISIPLKSVNNSPDLAYQKLENIYELWYKNFKY
ncbi:MAG TPA: cyanoexosortase A system-associated protein [Allocoleopsis sp.]